MNTSRSASRVRQCWRWPPTGQRRRRRSWRTALGAAEIANRHVNRVQADGPRRSTPAPQAARGLSGHTRVRRSASSVAARLASRAEHRSPLAGRAIPPLPHHGDQPGSLPVHAATTCWVSLPRHTPLPSRGLPASGPFRPRDAARAGPYRRRRLPLSASTAPPEQSLPIECPAARRAGAAISARRRQRLQTFGHSDDGTPQRTSSRSAQRASCMTMHDQRYRNAQFAADRVFRICCDAGIPVCRACCTRGPSPLAAKLVAGHGVGVSGSPGRTPGCHPGSRMGSRMAGTPMETPSDPGTGHGRQPGSSSGDRAPERRGGAVLCGLGCRGAGRCDRPARPHACLAVTPSDMSGQGERAHSRRYGRLGEKA